MKAELTPGVCGAIRLTLQAETDAEARELDTFVKLLPGCTFSGNGFMVSKLVIEFKNSEELGGLAAYIPPTD